MDKFKLLTKVRRQLFHLPKFRGREEVIRVLNRLLEDGRDHLVTDFDGDLLVNVNLNSHIERTVFWYRSYEPDIASLMNGIIKENSVCLDIGANVGIHSIFMAKRAKKGHVFCFEPFPPVFERLRINIGLNRFQNVTLFPVGLGEIDEARRLYTVGRAAENQGQSSFLNLPYLSSSVEVKVRNPSGIRELTELPRLDFIKIDVEGFEPAVIKSLLPLIRTHRSTLLFEYNKETWPDEKGCQFDDVLSRLEGEGYLFFAVEMGNRRIRDLKNLGTEYCNVLSVRV